MLIYNLILKYRIDYIIYMGFNTKVGHFNNNIVINWMNISSQFILLENSR